MRFGSRFFFPSLYRKIKDENPSISKDFTKLDWRLRDVNVGLQGGKTHCASFCTSLIAGLRRAFLFVDCVCLCRSVNVLTETE